MFKLIIFVLGAAIGFGGGVFWSVKNPEQAAKFNAEQERRVLEAKIAATKAIKEQLDQVAAKQQQQRTTPPAGASGFVAGFADGKSVPDPDVAKLRDEAGRQLADYQAQLDALNAKK